MIANIVIVAIVAAILALCIRSFVKGAGSCDSCAEESFCVAHATGKGSCPVAQDMVSKADAALSKAETVRGLTK